MNSQRLRNDKEDLKVRGVLQITILPDGLNGMGRTQRVAKSYEQKPFTGILTFFGLNP